MLGCVGLTIFGGIMALGNEHRRNLAISITIVNGLFIGWVELVTIVMAGLVVPPERIGVAQAFFGSTRAVSGTIASEYCSQYRGLARVLIGYQAASISRYTMGDLAPTCQIKSQRR